MVSDLKEAYLRAATSKFPKIYRHEKQLLNQKHKTFQKILHTCKGAGEGHEKQNSLSLRFSKNREILVLINSKLTF